MMQPEQNAQWVAAAGGGSPVFNAPREHKIFQEPLYTEASDALSKSEYKPWFGSVQRSNEAREQIP